MTLLVVGLLYRSVTQSRAVMAAAFFPYSMMKKPRNAMRDMNMGELVPCRVGQLAKEKPARVADGFVLWPPPLAWVLSLFMSPILRLLRTKRDKGKGCVSRCVIHQLLGAFLCREYRCHPSSSFFLLTCFLLGPQ
jgi:hypothetical protein